MGNVTIKRGAQQNRTMACTLRSRRELLCSLRNRSSREGLMIGVENALSGGTPFRRILQVKMSTLVRSLWQSRRHRPRFTAMTDYGASFE